MSYENRVRRFGDFWARSLGELSLLFQLYLSALIPTQNSGVTTMVAGRFLREWVFPIENVQGLVGNKGFVRIILSLYISISHRK